MQIIHPVNDAHGASCDKVPRNHLDSRVLHRSIGKTLREGRFDIKARFAARFLDALKFLRTGDAHTLIKLSFEFAKTHELFNLRAGTVHEHNAHSHAGNEAHVHHEMIVERPVGNDFPGKTDDKSSSVMQMDIRSCTSQPGNPLQPLSGIRFAWDYRFVFFGHGSFRTLFVKTKKHIGEIRLPNSKDLEC